jgi:hypothetical protein
MFQPQQIFAPGVANLAQAKNVFLRTEKRPKLSRVLPKQHLLPVKSKKRRRRSRRRFRTF